MTSELILNFAWSSVRCLFQTNSFFIISLFLNIKHFKDVLLFKRSRLVFRKQDIKYLTEYVLAVISFGMLDVKYFECDFS